MADQNVIEVMITKAKRVLGVNLKEVPDPMFREAVYRGLKDILNSGLTGDAYKTKDLEGDELAKTQEACFAKAELNLKAFLAGETKLTSAGSKRAKAVTSEEKEIAAEALRLAKLAVVDAIKADGGKVTMYSKTDITKWAKETLESDDGFYEAAKVELARRKATPVKISLSGLKPDAKKVAAAEARKAKAKAARSGSEKQLSAKQAAIPTRRKPGAQHTAH